MAGSEKTGPENADAGLFIDSICFITKTSGSDPRALAKIKNLWKILGAKTVILTAKQHDNIVAQISHLPHLLSVALVDGVNPSFIKFAANGFKDTTRIAAGDPQIWRDISFSNKQAILNAIAGFEKKLNLIKKSIKNNKKQDLSRQLTSVKRKRDILNK